MLHWTGEFRQLRWRAWLTMLVLVAGALRQPCAHAEEPAPAADPGAVKHTDGGIKARKEPVRGPAQQGGADRAAAMAKIADRLACVCIEGGDVKIDASKGLGQASCACPQATQVRAHLEESLAPLTTAELGDKRRVAEQIESAFVPLAAEYERAFRYSPTDYAWWMDNVRCVCDGCKPTVFFSKCQITCHPAITYKLRVRIFLAMGFTLDELLDYYLAEYNADKPPREQQTRDWLLPRKQKEVGWLVPALAIGTAILVLLFSVQRWSRRRRDEDKAADKSASTQDNGPAGPTDAERSRLLDELDRDEDGF